MTIDLTDPDALHAALIAPFDPADVDFRVVSGNRVAAYVDARTVAERLDQVFGPMGWSFTWEPIDKDEKGTLTLAKGTITVGGVSKSDIGDASNQDASKGCVSDCFKRTAQQWGIARYLYDGTQQYAEDSDFVNPAKKDRLKPEAVNRFRSKLKKPSGYVAQRATTAAPQRQQPAQEDHDPSNQENVLVDEQSPALDTRGLAARLGVDLFAAVCAYAGEGATKARGLQVQPLVHKDLELRERCLAIDISDGVYLARREEVAGHPAPFTDADLVKMEYWVYQQEQAHRPGILAQAPDRDAVSAAMRPPTTAQRVRIRELANQLSIPLHTIPSPQSHLDAERLITKYEEDLRARQQVATTTP